MRKDDPILEGMASTLWGSAWANHVDEHRCADLSGREITEIMPAVPEDAYLMAATFIGAIEQANGMGIHALLHKAATADHIYKLDDDLAREFGSDLAFMVTGAGVSWFDDHEEFPIKIPYGEESELQMLASESCEEPGRPQAKCGHYCDEGATKCRECGEATDWVAANRRRGARRTTR